jgi:hypothetical protein
MPLLFKKTQAFSGILRTQRNENVDVSVQIPHTVVYREGGEEI